MKEWKLEILAGLFLLCLLFGAVGMVLNTIESQAQERRISMMDRG